MPKIENSPAFDETTNGLNEIKKYLGKSFQKDAKKDDKKPVVPSISAPVLKEIQRDIGKIFNLINTNKAKALDVSSASIKNTRLAVSKAIASLNNFELNIDSTCLKYAVPGLKRISFEVAQEYDDQGSYYDSIEGMKIEIGVGSGVIVLGGCCDEYYFDEFSDEDIAALSGMPVKNEDDKEKALEHLASILPDYTEFESFAHELHDRRSVSEFIF